MKKIGEDPTPLVITGEMICIVRGQKVMLDSDLARLYGVSVKQLNRQVRRNMERFPKDFMFELKHEELERLRSQSVTSKNGSTGRGGARYRRLAFTEQGVAMLSTVLNSERAILVNIAIMRAFVRLRELLMTNKELAQKLNELEKRYDGNFRVVFKAIRELMAPDDEPPKPQIGFTARGKQT